MKQQTFYISDDNFYFKDLNECVEYENEFYIKLKQAEEKYGINNFSKNIIKR